MPAQTSPGGAAGAPPPAADGWRVRRLLSGAAITQQVYVAAKLGVADALAGGPQPSAAVAAAVGAHPEALHRLLRALVVHGLLVQEADGRFSLAPAGQALRADAPGSLRPLALAAGELGYGTWGALLHAVLAGQPAFARVPGTP